MVLTSASRAVLSLAGSRKLLGAPNVPAGGPFIVVSDSTTIVAPMAIACEFPLPLNILTTHRLLALPVIGQILRESNVIPINASTCPADFTLPLRVLRAGGSLAIFLPPSLPSDPSQSAMVVGAGMLAYETALPVVPVRVFEPPATPCRKMVVRVGSPTRFAGAVAALSTREKYRSVGASIQTRLGEISL